MKIFCFMEKTSTKSYWKRANTELFRIFLEVFPKIPKIDPGYWEIISLPIYTRDNNNNNKKQFITLS